MGLLIQLIYVLLGLIVPFVFSQSCQIGPITIGEAGAPISEDVGQDIVLWQSVGVVPPGLQIKFPDEFEGYLDFSVGDGGRGEIRAGPNFANYHDDNNKDPSGVIDFYVDVTCTGNTTPNPLLVLVYFALSNNKEPEFVGISELNLPRLRLPWDTRMPLNFDVAIVLEDRDYLVGAIQSVETDNNNFRVEFNNVTGEVKLFATTEMIPNGEFNIVARDGDSNHNKALPVRITDSLRQNIAAPLFNPNYYIVKTKPTSADGFLITNFVEALDPDNDPEITMEYFTQNPNITVNSAAMSVSFKDATNLPGPDEMPYIFEITATESPVESPQKIGKAVVILDYRDEVCAK